VFPPLGIDSSFLPYIRHPTRYKKVLVYAKIDGENWYDISDYVKEVTITNKLEFLSAPQIDTASITLANLHNEWTPTQYNDVFDPANGKFNGTVDQAYLQKEWEVKIYVIVDRSLSGEPLPEGVIDYWRYTLLGELNETVPEGYVAEDSDYNSIAIPLFYGVKTSLKEQHKTARLQLKDILYYATKKKLENDIFYINKTPTEILTDLLNRAGYSNYDFQETTYTCCFLAKKDQTIWQAIVNLMKGIGGKISTKPDGTIIFRARYDNYHEPDVAVDLAQDTFKKYDLNTERQYNKIIINSEGYDVDDETTDVINFELQDNNIIKAGKTATFELEYISDFAVDVLDTVTLWYEGDAFSEEDVDFTPSNNYTDDTYLKITKYERYADKVVLEIKNITESTDVKITRVKIQGTQVKRATVDKVIRENTTGEPDKEYSITSFFTEPVDEQNVPIPLKNIADILYDDINKTVHFGLSMNEFYPDVYAGNIVSFSVPRKGIASGNFLVLKAEHQLSDATFKSSLDLVEWSGLNYQVGDKTHTRSVRSPNPSENQTQQQIQDIQSDVQELQNQVTEVDNRTSNMDGEAPSIPQNIQYATLVNDKGESVIRIWWDTNPEEDAVSYYEVQWSYDGTNWRSVTTGGTMAEFVVAGNVTVYAKVRAVDMEGLKSDWSSVLTITSAKDEDPPATPTGISAKAYFQTISVSWDENTEADLDHYVVRYDTDSSFSDPTEVIVYGTYCTISGDTGNTYYIQVKAVDTSGNESDWSSTASATTAPVLHQDLSEELQDEIAKTDYLDNAIPSTPQNLQLSTDLDDSGNSVIIASWDESPETDVIGYELAWSLDGVHWHVINTTDTTLVWTVPGNTLIYVKIRSYDAETNKSEWSTVVSITSKKDEVPPATPTGLSAEGLFQKVAVKWNANTEEDFDHYVLEYDVNSDFSTAEQVITETNQFIINGEPNTTYYVRIKAVDTSGNESDWTDTVTASTEYIGALEINLQTSGYNLVINSDFTDGNGNPTDDGWKIWLGTPGEVVEVDTPATGKYAYQNAPNKVVWVYSAKPIPIQRDRAYIIEGYFRTMSGSSGVIFLAVRLLDENMNNISGDGTWWYYPAPGVRPPSSFKYYYGIFGANTSHPFPDNARYMQAGFVLNYNNGDSIQQVQGIRIREVIESAYIRDAAITSAKIKDGQILNAHIHDLAVDNSKIANVDASKITTGYLNADRIEAGTITFDKLAFHSTFSLPEGALAYWTNSLIDEINQIKPVGYNEINLAPEITLIPENAPEGSIVGDFIAGDKLFAGHQIQVGANVKIQSEENEKGKITVYDSGGNPVVKIGANALRDGRTGISIYSGALEIDSQNPAGDYRNTKIPSLLIWYSYPSSINELYDNKKAAFVFSQYDLVVFPDEIYNPSHEEHDNAVEIIKKAKEINPYIKFFGYIPTGNRSGTDACLSIAEIQNRISLWKEMGVYGIFLDEFGFDYDNNRTRQNEILDAVHEAGLVAFVNAWNPDDVFATSDGIDIHLNEDDWYLLENWGTWADTNGWYWSHSSDVFYRAWQVKYQYQHPKVAAVATVSPDISKEELEKAFKILYSIAAVYDLDAFNIEKIYYYSNDVKLLPSTSLPLFANGYKGAPEPQAESNAAFRSYSPCERRYGASPVGSYDIYWLDATNHSEPVYVFLEGFYKFDKDKGALDLSTNISTIIENASGPTYTTITGNTIQTGKIVGNHGTTILDLDNDQLAVNVSGEEAVLIGKEVFEEEGEWKDGIYVKSGNLYVDGSIVSELLRAKKVTAEHIEAHTITGDNIDFHTIKGDNIHGYTITFDKLAFRGTFSLPDGAIAYWTNSLIDEINQIKPEGYDEVNLSPTITLVPENAPEGSVVGDLLAGNKIYAGHEIQVGNSVFIKNEENSGNEEGKIIIKDSGNEIIKIGEKVTSDGKNGIVINQGEIVNSDGNGIVISPDSILIKNVPLELDSNVDIKFTASDVVIRDYGSIASGLAIEAPNGAEFTIVDKNSYSEYEFGSPNSLKGIHWFLWNSYMSELELYDPNVPGANPGMFLVIYRDEWIDSDDSNRRWQVIKSVSRDEKYEDTLWAMVYGVAGPFNSEGDFNITLPITFDTIYSVQLTTIKNVVNSNDDAWARLVYYNSTTLKVRIEYGWGASIASGNRYVAYLVFGTWNPS